MLTLLIGIPLLLLGLAGLFVGSRPLGNGALDTERDMERGSSADHHS